MPLAGTLDISARLADAPRMPSLSTEPWELAAAETLQLLYEIDDHNMEELLPRALNPTIPPTVFFEVMRVPESPVGPFALAQVRIGCRAGLRPRGLLTRAYCDSQDAAAALSDRWGYAVRPGEVRLRRLYDRVQAVVVADGRTILECDLIDPVPISGFDVQYIASVNLARVVRDGQETPRLVQVDPDYTIRRADRGQPELEIFDQSAWAADEVDPTFPISASFTVSDVKLPKLRYIMDPDRPALEGTEVL
ncbi:MAG: acetoacetate decarboxylase family protein [Dehalococcoidia bacterium]